MERNKIGKERDKNMTLYELRKKIQEQIDVEKTNELEHMKYLVEREIYLADKRLDELEESLKHAMDPRAIHEVRGRIEEICTIMGIVADGPLRVNYNRKKTEETK